MTNPLQGKHILLGITGSIACYKAVDLASKLTQHGAAVNTILTQASQNFISALSFQSVTGQRAYTDSDLWGHEGHIQHIALGTNADFFVIAPASANTIAKMASGIADNLLTITYLAARCPILIAPAMDGGMFSHPATQHNLNILQERNVIVFGPVEGRMASGLIGFGRMVEPEDLIAQIRYQISRNGPLAGKKIVVTAGGTVEPIDPVRVISNRSTGKQGFAMAQTALDMGAEVTLITAPTNLSIPGGAKKIDVSNADQMCEAVMNSIKNADVLIMAAAVADFKPVQASSNKIKKQQGIPKVELTLTTDILEEVSKYRKVHGHPHQVIGFAAESKDLITNAKSKLKKKNLDLIVANDISSGDSGFAVDDNRVILIDQEKVEELPLMRKEKVAEIVLERIRRKLI